MTTRTVDIGKLTGDGRVRNLSGKERGVAARAELNLNALDSSSDAVEILVPEYIDTISPSYFQGLFSESIIALKGKAGFEQKYRFRATSQVMRWIEIGIRNATTSRRSLI